MDETLSMIHDIEELLMHTPDDSDLIRMLNDLQLVLKQQSSSKLTTSTTPPQFTPGSPCSIPFPCPWSNATILLPARVLPSTNEDTSINAHVLILTPLTQETIPCSSLLSSSDCDTQHCIYSHGYPLKADWLLPIETMDIYNKDRHYHPNSNVLYKSDSKIGDLSSTPSEQQQQVWKKAVLLSSSTDSTGEHQWHISTGNGDTDLVGENQVIPLVYLDEDPSTYDDDKAVDSYALGNEDTTDALDQTYDNNTVWDSNKAFGAWQSHTSGFGEKMLKKMGYVQGKGLGTTRQGRLEPVQAYDKGSQYSQSKRPGLGSLEKKKKVKTKTNTSVTKDVAGTSSMFDMMNSILDHDALTNDDDDGQKRSTQPQQKSQKNGSNDSSGSNSKNNASTTTPKQKNQRRLWQLQDKMDRLDKEWRQGMAAVKRNKGTTMEREFQAKVDIITRQLKSVKQEITLVQGSLSRTKNYEKMTTF